MLDTRSPIAPPSSRSFDQLEISYVTDGDSLSIVPTPAQSARWPFIAIFSLEGAARCSQPDRVIAIEAADFVVVRNDSAVAISTGAGTRLAIIRVPAATLGPQARSMDSADGRVWQTADGTASLVGYLLNGIAAQRTDYSPANPAQLAQHIVGLMALLCADGRPSADVHGRGHLLQAAQDYIEAHLGELDLTPDRIAAEQNVSTRTLHRLFEGEGLTVRGWTRTRRLEHCRVDLSTAGLDGLPVSSIGARWGLWDAAHFSRLFKAEYGSSPRAYRASLRDHSCMEGCAHWLETGRRTA
jgi:AraC-like DNA-binding protein